MDPFFVPAVLLVSAFWGAAMAGLGFGKGIRCLRESREKEQRSSKWGGGQSRLQEALPQLFVPLRELLRCTPPQQFLKDRPLEEMLQDALSRASDAWGLSGSPAPTAPSGWSEVMRPLEPLRAGLQTDLPLLSYRPRPESERRADNLLLYQSLGEETHRPSATGDENSVQDRLFRRGQTSQRRQSAGEREDPFAEGHGGFRLEGGRRRRL